MDVSPPMTVLRPVSETAPAPSAASIAGPDDLAFAITVLRALGGRRLVKTFARNGQNRVIKRGSDKAGEFILERPKIAGAAAFFALLNSLEQRADACIVRGAPGPCCPPAGQPVFRLLHPQPAYADEHGRRVSKAMAGRQGGPLFETIWLPTLIEEPTAWLLLDFEKLQGPPQWRGDLAGTAAWLRQRLPTPFATARCWYQATGSAADLTKPDLGGDEVRMRLAFLLDTPLTRDQLDAWLGGVAGVDPATFRTAQEIYVGRPVFEDGLTDPLAVRSGILDGLEDVVGVPGNLPIPPIGKIQRARPLLRVVEQDANGLGLLESGSFEAALARIDGTAGSVRQGLGRAARAYIDDVGPDAVDRSALAARLTAEALKHRRAEAVAGYDLQALVRWHLEHAGEAETPLPPGPVVHQPEELAPAEASARIDRAVRAWLRRIIEMNDPHHAAIVADPGLGKTSITLQALADLAAGRTMHFYVPTLQLGGEVVRNARRIGLDAILIRGRGQAIEKGRPDRLCAKDDVAAAVARAGWDVWNTLCCRRQDDGIEERCEFFGVCPYVRQFAATEGKVVVLAHDYLSLPKRRLAKPDLIVIDERFHPSLLRTASLPLGRVTAPRAETRRVTAEAIAEHLQDATALLAAVEAGKPVSAAGVSAERLAGMAQLEFMLADLPTISPGQSHAEQKRRVQRLIETEAYRLARLWRLLKEDLGRAGPTQRVVVARGVAWNEELQDRVFLHWRAELRLPADVPALLLDADLDPLIVGKVLPLAPGHITHVRARLNAEVVQVDDTVASRRKLLGGDFRDQQRAMRLQDAIRALAVLEASRNGQVLLVTYKPVATMIEAPEGVELAWFGAVRGLDGWKNHTTVIVAGREQPWPEDMETAARAWFGDDAEPLLLLGEYVRCTMGYRTRGGERRGVVVQVHPDPRVQALLEQQREREIEQAAGRLRLVHRQTRARVLLLTSIPTRLAVDRFTTWKEIMPDKLVQAIVRGDGVLPLSAAERARLHPDLWPTAKAAEHYRGRHQGKGPRSPIESPYWQMGTLSAATLVSYRRPGQGRGSPHQAVLPGRVDSPSAAEDQLAAVVGEIGQVRIVDVILRSGVIEAPPAVQPEPFAFPGLKPAVTCPVVRDVIDAGGRLVVNVLSASRRTSILRMAA